MIKQARIGNGRKLTMMDGGLVRGPGRTDRPAAARPEQTRRQPAEPQAALYDDEPSAPQRPSAPRRQAPAPKKSLFSRIKLPLIIALVVIVVVAGGWFAWTKTQTGTAIDDSKYQAVFFTNGQVYFGKLTVQSGDYLKLTDIYYLQSQQAAPAAEKDSKNPQQTSTDDGNVQLIKLGDEIHGPEDQMTISKDQVLFYENLKPDGKVATSIKQFKTK